MTRRLAALAFAALPSLVAAQVPDAGEADLRAAFERSLASAREARDAGEAERALREYEAAFDLALRGCDSHALGTRSMRSPLDGSELQVPAGFELREEVAQEATRAADALGRPKDAAGWARRTDLALPSAAADADGALGYRAKEILESLRKVAEGAGRAQDASFYAGLLDADRRLLEARWARQAAQRLSFQRKVGAAALAVLALAGYWLWKLARAVAQARREETPKSLLDYVPFSGVTITRREPDGKPYAWRSSALDLVGRVAMSSLLWSFGALGFVGGAVFLHLGVDKAGPENLGATALVVGLGDLMLAFGVFMTLMNLASPPGSVRREAVLTADGLLVRTTRGLIRKVHFEERLPYASIRALRVDEYVDRVQHVTVRYHLAAVVLDGRAMVIGGSHERAKVESLLAGLAEATGLPVQG